MLKYIENVIKLCAKMCFGGFVFYFVSYVFVLCH